MAEIPYDTDADAPAVIVSCDSHVGPRLIEDLRPYCPAKLIEQYDEYAEQQEADKAAMAALFEQSGGARGAAMMSGHPNMATAGHYDPHVRLREMDADGVMAEAFWHFSQNGETLPWVGNGLGFIASEQLDLGVESYRMYNRWVADFCSVDPQRLMGLVYIPVHDIDAAVKELEKGAEAGLRVVNFPAPGRPGALEFNNPAWDRFWAACQDLGFTLATHSGTGPRHNDYFQGPGGIDLAVYEGGGFFARRGVWWLIHGGVFERFPNLRLIIAEQYEGWYLPTMRELDAVTMSFGSFASSGAGSRSITKLPSEYMRTNVFIGGSLMSVSTAVDAVAEDYVDNLLWGRDYPHTEGSWQAQEDPDAEPTTKLSLRHVMSHVPLDAALKIVGRNALNVYGIDPGYAAEVAARIAAPTGAELLVPPTHIPDETASIAFTGQPGPRPLEPERVERARRRAAASQLDEGVAARLFMLRTGATSSTASRDEPADLQR
jgi:predicted TIM-barrel fold metal-dependent hydrolase